MKRFRHPKLKDGELRMFWGKMPWESPEIIYSWQGDIHMKRDAALLHYYFETKHPDPFAEPAFSKMQPSLLQDLDDRGYDITTLKFSIMKKKAVPQVTGN